MAGAFDIYQTRSGYTAVDNPVQRRILEALAEGDLQLPELVEITGRSKPTLSSSHMKSLLQRELVEEVPDPDDKRRKSYRLMATRIGSSDLPVPKLRDAVEQYVSMAPMGGQFPLAAVLDVLCAADDAAASVRHAQGVALGRVAAARLQAAGAHAVWRRLLAYLESQDVARAVRWDLEAPEVELELLEGASAEAAPLGDVLAGFVQGVLEAQDADAGRPLRGQAGQDRRVVLSPA